MNVSLFVLPVTEHHRFTVFVLQRNDEVSNVCTETVIFVVPEFALNQALNISVKNLEKR